MNETEYYQQIDREQAFDAAVESRYEDIVSDWMQSPTAVIDLFYEWIDTNHDDAVAWLHSAAIKMPQIKPVCGNGEFNKYIEKRAIEEARLRVLAEEIDDANHY